MEAALLSAMLFAFFVVSLVLLSQKGLFIDDSMHMPAGYSYLLTHDYRLNQEHPPLIKLLSGLGLWKLHPQFPFESPGWQQAATPGDPEDGMVRIEEAFFESNAKQFEQIAFYGRLPVLVIPLLLLLAVWWITRQLFGPVPALIAVFLMATEPNIIGNAIVVQNDVAAAFALLLFVIAVKKFMTGATVTGGFVLGGALGLALVTKYSLVVLVPVSCAIVIAWGMYRLIRKRSSLARVVLSSVVVFVTAYLILIAFYSFHIDRIDADESSKIASWVYLSGQTAEAFKRFLMWLPPLLPRYFVCGIDMVVQDSRDGRPAFLLGQISDTGWWYYFPVAFALKTTIPFLLASIGGLVWALYQVLARKSYAIVYVLLPGVSYLALTMTSHLNIGVRHLLPMFPFAAMAGAGFISAVVEFGLKRDRRLGVALIAIALVPGLLIAVSTFPNYLTYFSPLAGGAARGWQTLSDSNVETGQEVKPLARYLKDHGENRVTGIMVGGEFLKFYGIQADDFPGWYDDDDADEDSGEDADEHHQPEPIKTEYVAIGAWYLSEIDLSEKQKEIIDLYRQQKPEVMVGNSIFVFRRNSRHRAMVKHPILEKPSLRRQDEFLAAVVRSRKLHRHWASPPTTAVAFRENLKRLRNGNHIGHWIRTETGELAGVININEIVRGVFCSGYLGYYAFVPHNGRGYMTRGLSAVLAEAFLQHGLHRLEANIQPDNEASRRLVQRFGFRLEGFSPRYLKLAGRWRDHERWAITVEEWRSGPPIARHNPD